MRSHTHSHSFLFVIRNDANAEDGAKMVTVRVDTKPAEAIP